MTLSYETCKKLKEAGFPKEHFIVCEGCYFQNHQHVENEPTLSELIGACGEDGIFTLKNSSIRWVSTFGDPDNFRIGNGSTPEEAVAKLYLALKSK